MKRASNAQHNAPSVPKPPLNAWRSALRSPHLKRALDLTGALAGVSLAAVPMTLISIAVRLDMGSPVLFRQRRPGLRGRPFTIYKFRTMKQATDRAGNPLPDAERLTKLGRFLRATSLDELPELFCVLNGSMSLVGPRPLLMQYLDRYTPSQARRHDVKPGITGWAVIHGRNALSWEEKFQLDLWYVDHWTIWLDLKILYRTPLEVIRRKGIHAQGHATMPEFMG